MELEITTGGKETACNLGSAPSSTSCLSWAHHPFYNAFKTSPAGMCIVEPEGHILDTNSALCGMLGVPADDLLNTTWHEFFQTEDLSPLLQRLRGSDYESGIELIRDVHLRLGNGRIFPCRTGISLLDDGRFLFQFVEQQKSDDRATGEEEKHFHLLADSLPSMIWLTDQTGDVIYVNHAARRFCNTSAGASDAQLWNVFTRPQSAPPYLQAFESAVRNRDSFCAEALIKRPDGQWRVLGSKAEPRFSSNGDYLGHFGMSADITERQAADRARQFQLSLLHSIQEEMQEGILVVNDVGFNVSFNRRFLQIWGLSDKMSQAYIDDAVGMLDHPAVLEALEDSEAFLKRVQELYTNPDEEDHCEIRLKDGRTLERHSTGLRTEQGEYLGRVWFFRDISAYRHAEISLNNAKAATEEANRHLLAEREVLENERRMLRALIDNVPDFMYVKDAESRFVVANSHLARAVKVNDPEKMIGKTDFDLYPPELATGFFEDEQNLIRTGQALFNHEESGLDGCGNVLNVLTTKVPLRDGTDKIIGIAGVGRDITARKRMEDALREAEQNYRGIFDSAIVGVFQSTPAGRFLSVNPAMAENLGYESPEEMIASITDIATQFYLVPDRHAELIETLASTREVLNFECEALRKDGRRVWLSMNARAIGHNAEIVRYEGMCEDITERKLLREQLYQAQKLESVGQLAAGIAHEINTPTQYIGDNLRFLKDAFHDLGDLLIDYEQLLGMVRQNGWPCDKTDTVIKTMQRIDCEYLIDEVPRAVEQALEGVSRVSALVSAMKEFSHPGAKEKTPTDLNHAIASTITVARNEWKYVADMETDFDSSILPVPCLAGEFNQVILNLIVNSAHAIGDASRLNGSVKGLIRIQTRNFFPWVEIQVQDSGSGIPESILGRIFDPFFTTKEVGKGTGQGLAIARSVIVDKHGGTIDVESKLGRGTTFTIRLPQSGRESNSKDTTP